MHCKAYPSSSYFIFFALRTEYWRGGTVENKTQGPQQRIKIRLEDPVILSRTGT